VLGGFGKRGGGVRYAGSWDSIRLWYDEPNAISNEVGYASTTAAHTVLRFACTMTLATRSKHTHTRAISKIVDDEAFPDYAMPKKTTGRKNKARSTRTSKA
jgi:hypothetical protein